jgi:hypothetical protein
MNAPNGGRWPLDLPLIRWSRYPRDTWTLQDALQDVICFGQKGSGKTSATGRLFALKYLEAGFGGIVLCAQEEESANWRNYLTETGREDDGRFFTLNGPYRFNPLAWEACKSGGADFAENLVHLLSDVASIRKKRVLVAGEVPFWGEQRDKLLRNAISLLMLVDEPVTLSGIYQIVSSAPHNPLEADAHHWRKESHLFSLLTKAQQAHGNARDVVSVRHYFLKEWPRLDERPRSTVEADLTGLLDPLTRGKLAEFFGTTTNLSPDDLEKGRVIVIDTPMRYRQIGQYAALLWLHSVYRSAGRRAWNPPHTRPLFVFIDETQYYLTPADPIFQSTSRHHGYSVVRLTQSLPGLRAAYGTQDDTDALLSHCCTRVYHLNTCAVTNEWASKSIGQDVQVRQSVNEGMMDDLPQMSFAEAHDASCPPQVFMRLKSGGKRHRREVHAVVTQAGRTFLDGKRWIISGYRQSK